MLNVGILQGPDGRWYGTATCAIPDVVCEKSSSMCLAELLSSIEWDYESGALLDSCVIRIFPWTLRAAAEDLMPENIWDAIASKMEKMQS